MATTKENRGAIIEIVNMFRAKIVDVAADSLVIEVTGTEDKIDAMVAMMMPFGIKELVRTGRVAMTRGARHARRRRQRRTAIPQAPLGRRRQAEGREPDLSREA